jgi:hypothetical protein
MDIGTEIDLDQYDDDINTAPQHLSNTTVPTVSSSNRELLSK